MLRNLTDPGSVLGMYLKELRDTTLQRDRKRFRDNLRRVGSCMAYEISKQLEFVNESVTTPLGTAPCKVLKEQPVVATVLRAGLPMHEGFLDIFDKAESAFIAAYRREGEGAEVKVELEYVSAPSIGDRVLILCDPMLATGTSLLRSLEAIEKRGKARQVHIAAIFASAPGIAAVQHSRPDVHLWVAAIDPELNSRAYIVPGLGDAGDLAFGEKL